MFVLIGIIVLIVSFAVALASLVLEERKHSPLDSETPEPDLKGELPPEKSAGDIDREKEEQRRLLEEKVAAASRDSGVPNEEAKVPVAERRDPFPWEDGFEAGRTKSVSENVLESEPETEKTESAQVAETETVEFGKDPTLSGTINIQDISKKGE